MGPLKERLADSILAFRGTAMGRALGTVSAPSFSPMPNIWGTTSLSIPGPRDLIYLWDKKVTPSHQGAAGE